MKLKQTIELTAKDVSELLIEQVREKFPELKDRTIKATPTMKSVWEGGMQDGCYRDTFAGFKIEVERDDSQGKGAQI